MGGTYCLSAAAKVPRRRREGEDADSHAVPFSPTALSRRRAGPAGDLDASLAPGLATGLSSRSDDGQLGPCWSTEAFLASLSKRPFSRLPVLALGTGDAGMGILEGESLSQPEQTSPAMEGPTG